MVELNDVFLSPSSCGLEMLFEEISASVEMSASILDFVDKGGLVQVFFSCVVVSMFSFFSFSFSGQPCLFDPLYMAYVMSSPLMAF